MLRNLMLIINPFSGRGFSNSALGAVIGQLCRNGCVVTSYYAGESTIEEIAYEHARKYEVAICIGGDGTLSSVVSGILRSGISIPIGYIPAGTANDIANTLALPKTPAVAAKRIIDGKPRPLDIGRFNGRFFTYIAAFGAFTGVSYQTPQSAKNALGHLAYVLGGLADVAAIRARHTVVEYDGGVVEGDYIFGGIMNSTSVAGFVKLDPVNVDLADGLFEVILVKQPVHMMDLLDIIAEITAKSYDGDNIVMLHTSKARFTFETEVPWTVDGENGGKHSNVEITNHHEAVSIVV